MINLCVTITLSVYLKKTTSSNNPTREMLLGFLKSSKNGKGKVNILEVTRERKGVNFAIIILFPSEEAYQGFQ